MKILLLDNLCYVIRSSSSFLPELVKTRGYSGSRINLIRYCDGQCHAQLDRWLQWKRWESSCSINFHRSRWILLRKRSFLSTSVFWIRWDSSGESRMDIFIVVSCSSFEISIHFNVKLRAVACSKHDESEQNKLEVTRDEKLARKYEMTFFP